MNASGEHDRAMQSDFALRGDFIPLDALLKASGLTSSGGAATVLIASGAVQVDGRTELRRTRKLRAGQVVQFGDATIRLLAATA